MGLGINLRETERRVFTPQGEDTEIRLRCPAALCKRLSPLSNFSSRSSQHVRPQLPRANLCSSLEFFLTLAGLQSRDNVFGVEIGSYRILCKGKTFHELIGVLSRIEIVHLRFEHVAVGILVVDTGGRTVIDTPVWLNSRPLALAVGQKKISKSLI